MSPAARRRASDRVPRHEFVVVANRLPVRSVIREGVQSWITSPGGLVSGLKPVMDDYENAAWVGWSGVADFGAGGFQHDGLHLYPVALTAADMELYYEGFSNGTLWPLYHDAIEKPEYHRTWWEAYVSVNRRFANAAAEVVTDDGVVWIQDYQLQLVPGMLRELKPNIKIGFFLHIPFPAWELYIRMPWRTQIVEGLLGADLVGFQTAGDASNFRRSAARVAAAKTKGNQIAYGDRIIKVGAFPIGIDHGRITDRTADPAVRARTEALLEALGNPQKLLLGVDRLDYTKGIEVRLRAYLELLREERISVDEVAMVQVAEPSRSNVQGYAPTRAEIERLVGDINGNFGTVGRPAVHYLHQGQPADELVAMYRAADVMLVTPFRDGMNLVAKEYVACREDETGVLVLSEFAGAANELPHAILVNPHDIDGMKRAIVDAIHLPESEQRRRMRPMRRSVRQHDAQSWARGFLEALAN